MPKGSKERDSAIMGGLTLLMLLLWLGFFVHRSPRFAGSLLGHSIGILGAALMLVPLLYTAVKRIPPLKRRVTKVFPMRTLLAWHIYAGIVGPILVLLHTGHRFNSPLGIVLTGMTILVVLSGYIGRYLLRNIGSEIREKKKLLKEMEAQYDRTREMFAASDVAPAELLARFSFWGRLRSAMFVGDLPVDPGAATLLPRAARLAESRADLEYAIRTHETFKAWFGRWLKFHIFISLALYVLLGLHVWASIHFGLRWLP
jgi:hypothetical protein